GGGRGALGGGGRGEECRLREVRRQRGLGVPVRGGLLRRPRLSRLSPRGRPGRPGPRLLGGRARSHGGGHAPQAGRGATGVRREGGGRVVPRRGSAARRERGG